MTVLKTRRQYTHEEKARAVALAKETGLTAASAALGVGRGEGDVVAVVRHRR